VGKTTAGAGEKQLLQAAAAVTSRRFLPTALVIGVVLIGAAAVEYDARPGGALKGWVVEEEEGGWNAAAAEASAVVLTVNGIRSVSSRMQGEGLQRAAAAGSAILLLLLLWWKSCIVSMLCNTTARDGPQGILRPI
jgi:hypothetical protein